MIKRYTKNPWYWQYRDEPVLLIGGTDDDNLFQWTGKELTDHLDLLISAGGNYVRNTMSDRDEGNVYAFTEPGSTRHVLASHYIPHASDNWDRDWPRISFDGSRRIRYRTPAGVVVDE